MQLWQLIGIAIVLGLIMVVVLVLLFLITIRAMLKEAHRASQDWLKDFE